MKNRNRLYMLLLGLLFASTIYSQTFIDSTLTGTIITEVKVYGNNKTKQSIILREMKQRVGDRVVPEILEEDRKRIQSLNLFNRVVLHVRKNQEGAAVEIYVTEKFYFYPFPIIFFSEQDFKKFSYGAGVVHLNFRGRAEIIDGIFWLGYNPRIHLEYYNPWICGNRHLLFYTNLFSQKIKSKHYRDQKVYELHSGISIEIGKRFGLFSYLNFNLGYKQISISPPQPYEMVSGTNKDLLPSAGISFLYDSRDLKEYPSSGWKIYLWVNKKGVGSVTDVDYLFYGFDIRKYIPLGRRPSIAFRFTTNLSEGRVPVYDRVYLGYSERIRGHFNLVREGENRIISSIALHVPLLPIRYFSISNLNQLQNLKFGISLGLFVDTGSVWFQGENLKSLKFTSGFGFGIHFHVPYINLLRVEMAFDEKYNSQFITTFGVDI